ncbi:hypothetical protein Y1Q_0013225 [Alligator mississippiensis]|uniref:Uncharacterized protein n=1 Tax=Alligator mississippiensis TaxID=8496 RepID=A0A151NU41_ALLMI|nr:hypothetical protein Y1Q_0013225 [Alligator mississippiensis]
MSILLLKVTKEITCLGTWFWCFHFQQYILQRGRIFYPKQQSESPEIAEGRQTVQKDLEGKAAGVFAGQKRASFADVGSLSKTHCPSVFTGFCSASGSEC